MLEHDFVLIVTVSVQHVTVNLNKFKTKSESAITESQIAKK